MLLPHFKGETAIKFQIHYPNSRSSLLTTASKIFTKAVVRGVIVQPVAVTQTFNKSNQAKYDKEGYQKYLLDKGMSEQEAQATAEKVYQIFTKNFDKGNKSVSAQLPNRAFPGAKMFITDLFDVEEGAVDSEVNIDLIVDDIVTDGVSMRNMRDKLLSKGVNENNIFCLTLFCH